MKKFMIGLAIGGFTGTAFGVVYTFTTMIQNEKIYDAAKDVFADKITKFVFEIK